MSHPFASKNYVPDPQVDIDANGQLVYLQLPRPSDFHNHFRLGELRQATTPEVSWPYKYVLAMPNTGNKADGTSHIYNVADALTYRREILAILANNGITQTDIVMTIYLAPETTVQTIEDLATCGLKVAIKAYPPGGTTNSGEAAPILSKLDVLQAAERLGIPLLIHGERVYEDDGVTEILHPEREYRFYNDIYPVVRRALPKMRICLEHITTENAVKIVRADTSGLTVCTITPQHGLLTNQAFNEPWGGAHARCMPYLKGPRDRFAIRMFMTSGDPRVILGTDCAPHVSAAKNKPFAEAACGCYTPHALALYAAIFHECCALDHRFVRFACTNGPDWWGLPRPDFDDTIALVGVDDSGIPSPTPVPGLRDVVIPLGWHNNVLERLPLGIELLKPNEY